MGMVLTALLEYIDYVGSLEQLEAKAGQLAFFETAPEIAASAAMAPAVTVAAASGSDKEAKTDIAEAFAVMENSAYTALGEIPLIVIDAGHGGEDSGCLWNGVMEKEVNLAIAKLVKEKLTGLGYRVVMTREDDSYVTLADRVRIANESGADLYISIHQNAYEDVRAEGIEVWYNEDKSEGDDKRLALLLGQQTVKATGAKEREFQSDSRMYGVINTTMPACLIETGFLSNKAEREKLVTAQYQEQIAQGITQGVSYYFEPKTMYLTFDDGPFRENTLQVLSVLRERNIKGTFFLVGEYVEKNPDIARQIVEEGHTIGIHCYRHDYHELYAGVDSYLADFEKARQIIFEVTGVETRMFRFPGGSINDFNRETRDQIIQDMTERGYIYYDWNASLEDAVNNPKPEQLIANALDTAMGRKKVILLAHDVVKTTGNCLDELLDYFPEYRMLPLTEEVEPIQF
ncbi:MAG: N-acetylmuramoyl-L-alanine amidase [Lachnospiraceae bacterium]|nr:N-acetylmuramoyl-L-alanine amidase [Lachnospiraceae bacterium]